MKHIVLNVGENGRQNDVLNAIKDHFAKSEWDVIVQARDYAAMCRRVGGIELYTERLKKFHELVDSVQDEELYTKQLLSQLKSGRILLVNTIGICDLYPYAKVTEDFDTSWVKGCVIEAAQQVSYDAAYYLGASSRGNLWHDAGIPATEFRAKNFETEIRMLLAEIDRSLNK